MAIDWPGSDDLNALIAFFQQRYLLQALAEKVSTDNGEARWNRVAFSAR
jgi:hypothetical protein